jgi:hypothetical protein
VSANRSYASFPDHALHHVPQAVLEAGWRAVGAEPTGDAAEARLKALADMVLLAVLPGLRECLHGEALDALRVKLAHHLVEREDPCQDRGADYPCDVALALGVSARPGHRRPDSHGNSEARPGWVDSMCCNGTGFADYAAVRCPAPDCPVPEAQWRKPVDRYAHLTEDERRYLAMHAWYEAERQLDPRNYAAGPHPEGGQKLDERWHTRQERCDRWRAIADALHGDPWDQAPYKQAYGQPLGVTNAMVAASHEANEGYVHRDPTGE